MIFVTPKSIVVNSQSAFIKTFEIKKRYISFCWSEISLGILNTIDNLTNFSIDIYDLHTNKKTRIKTMGAEYFHMQ